MGLCKKVSSLFVLLVGLLVVSLPSSQRVEAADTVKSGFTVEIVKSTNQTNQNLNFFSILVEPGQEQNFTFRLKSASSKALSIKIVPTVATTTSTGTIVYNSITKQRDSSLKTDFTKLGPKSMTVKLEPNETRDVTFTAKVPTEGFSGVVLGGFSIVNTAESKAESVGNGVQIRNQYAYAIAVDMQMVNHKAVAPDLKLLSARPSISGGYPAVFANVQNFMPYYILSNELTFSAEVYKQGSDKVLHKSSLSKMNFAPNSTIDYPVSWGNNEMQPGDYRLHLIAKTTSGKKWEFNKNFTVTASQAKKINEVNPDLKKDYTKLYILIAVVVALLLIGAFVLVFLIGKRRSERYKKELEEAKRAASKKKRRRRPRPQSAGSAQDDSDGHRQNDNKRHSKPSPDTDGLPPRSRKSNRK